MERHRRARWLDGTEGLFPLSNCSKLCPPKTQKTRVDEQKRSRCHQKMTFVDVNKQVIHKKGHNEVFILEKQRDKLPIVNDF